LRVRRRTKFWSPQYTCWNLYPLIHLRLAVYTYDSISQAVRTSIPSLGDLSRSAELKRTRPIFRKHLRTLIRSYISKAISPIRPPNEDCGAMPLSDDANNDCNPSPPNCSKRHSTRGWIKVLTIASLCLLILSLYIHQTPGPLRQALTRIRTVVGIVDRPGAVSIASLESAVNATRNVSPMPCHSHNDYRRNVPLFDALHAGCTSVEADVWLTGNGTELYVGHHRHSLSRGRTLRSLYLDPLINMLNGT
jgi:hypothetical protein